MIKKILDTKDLKNSLALALVITLFAWTIGYSLSVDRAWADSLSNISDTISDSNLGAYATHTIQYTNATNTTTGQTIRITFDPLTDRFDGFAAITYADITGSGITPVASCTAGANEVTVTTSTTANLEGVILTVCSGDSILAGTRSVTIAGNRITNATSTGSYVIRVTAGNQAMTDTRIAIISNVTVTAAVDTTFTFTISGVATGTTLTNGATTTRGSTSTALAFGTLPVNTPVTMAQLLNVTTNARNGFVVTVKENQDLTSAVGATIDTFRNGESTATPIPWVAPSSTLDVRNTYGHIGLTSDDSDLNSGEFGTSTANLKWAGNFNPTSTRQVFSHTGPSDGSTQDKGQATVAYRIQIGPLQEAGNDYNNILTYVATPTF